MSAEKILEKIRSERCYQCDKWGNDFDDQNTINDWSAYISEYLGKATAFRALKKDQRNNLLEVATLAIAALESFERNGKFADRHYD